MAHQSREERDLAYLDAAKRITVLAEAAMDEPHMQERVILTITGRGDDGRFNTVYQGVGMRWQVYRNVCLEAANAWIDPDYFLSDDCGHIQDALALVENAAEAFGNDSYGLNVRPFRTPLPKCARRNCGHGQRSHPKGGACRLYYCDCSAYVA